MNKNILIVTPFFAPQTHAAVFRAFKLVKYLKRNGWNPVVLTVNRNYIYLEDPGLLEEIKDVPIYHADYMEPTLRGLKMALGGKDTTFKTLKAQRHKTDKSASVETMPTRQTGWRKYYQYVLNRWVQVPDRFVLWKRHAVKLGKKIIKQHDISIVYTTCLPFTSNQIGLALKRKTGVKWVADFRDPVTYAKRMYSDYMPVFVKQKKIEQKTMLYADAITTVAGAYVSIFNDFYESKYLNKCHFIPTGLDDEYLPSETFRTACSDNSIIFIGEYLQEYGDHFLRIFSKAVHSDELKNKSCVLKIVGNKTINYNRIQKYIEDLDLVNNVQFIDHIPQKELYKIVVGSKATLLIPGHNGLWWSNFAKMVDYIALQVPVLAMVPGTSEARTELSRANTGIFIDDDEHGVSLIKDIFLGNIVVSPDKEYCKRYLASSQVRSFIELFESL